MRLVEAVVLANREALPGAWLLRLAAPGIAGGARPGQLVLLRPETGPHPMLRPGLTVHRLGRGEISLLFACPASPDGSGAAHDGLPALARCRPGDRILAQGPLGRGFVVSPGARNLLLVGQGLAVSPLVALAEWALAAGLAVTLLADAVSAAGLLPPAMVPAEVEYRVATADGSLGHTGSALDLLTPARESPLVLWADQLVAAASLPFYLRLRDAVAATRTRRESSFAQGLVGGVLGCGMGACQGCAIATRQGTLYLCKHGPVVDLDDMLL